MHITKSSVTRLIGCWVLNILHEYSGRSKVYQYMYIKKIYTEMREKVTTCETALDYVDCHGNENIANVPTLFQNLYRESLTCKGCEFSNREMSTKQIDISTFYPSAIRTPFLKETTRYWSKRPGRFLYGSTFFLHNTIHIWKNIPSPCGTSDGSQHTEELHNTWRPMAADRGCPLDARGGMSGYNVVIQ
jgi:hypothetical protein